MGSGPRYFPHEHKYTEIVKNPKIFLRLFVGYIRIQCVFLKYCQNHTDVVSHLHIS